MATNKNTTNAGTHPGLPVAGYKAQTQSAVDLVNENKIAEEKLLRQMDTWSKSKTVDPRWLAIARTSLEQGYMFLNRAIFQPTRVALPGDAPSTGLTTKTKRAGKVTAQGPGTSGAVAGAKTKRAGALATA